jgi:hypothetical protein
MYGKPNGNSAFDKLRHYESAEAMILGLSPSPVSRQQCSIWSFCFVYLFLKHSSRPKLTTCWHPQVKLNGRGASTTFTGTPVGLNQARFTLGVWANVQPKSSIPIGAKDEISPKGFTLGVKAEIEKNFSMCPKLLINAELYGPEAEKRIPS